MESASEDEHEDAEPSPSAAAARLREHDRVRERVEGHEQARSFALLRIGVALAMAVFVAAFLFAVTPHGEALRGAGDSSPMLLALLPMLFFGQLISGAVRRFGIRIRPTAGHWVTGGIVVVGFGVLAALTILTGWRSGWTNLAAGLVTFLVLAALPVQRLLDHPSRSGPSSWSSRALTPPVRRTTVGMGAAMASSAGASTLSWFPLVWLAIVVVFLVILLGMNSVWGLPRAGYEWGSGNWAGFGVASGVLLVLALLLRSSDVAPTATGVVAAGVILAAMLPTAFLPARAQAR